MRRVDEVWYERLATSSHSSASTTTEDGCPGEEEAVSENEDGSRAAGGTAAVAVEEDDVVMVGSKAADDGPGTEEGRDGVWGEENMVDAEERQLTDKAERARGRTRSRQRCGRRGSRTAEVE